MTGNMFCHFFKLCFIYFGSEKLWEVFFLIVVVVLCFVF